MRGRTAFLSVLAVGAVLVACGGASAPPDDPGAASETLAGADAAVDASTAVSVKPVCETDDDCSAQDLCVDHVCRQGCRESRDCAGGSCNFDNGRGGCFNEHGCNPPPPGTMCPMICWGYCEAQDG